MQTVNVEALRSLLGRNPMDSATTATLGGQTVYVLPLTPAMVSTAQKQAAIPGKSEVDNIKAGIATGIQMVVDEHGKQIFTVSDMPVLLKSPVGLELIAIVGAANKGAEDAGNGSPKPTEETPAP